MAWAVEVTNVYVKKANPGRHSTGGSGAVTGDPWIAAVSLGLTTGISREISTVRFPTLWNLSNVTTRRTCRAPHSGFAGSAFLASNHYPSFSDLADLARIHRRRASGQCPEAARGCSCESGIMVLKQQSRPQDKEHPIDATTQPSRSHPNRV